MIFNGAYARLRKPTDFPGTTIFPMFFSRSKRPELIILRSHHLHVSFTLDIKRLIGRRFDEACVDSDMGKWPFQVISGWELFCQLLDH